MCHAPQICHLLPVPLAQHGAQFGTVLELGHAAVVEVVTALNGLTTQVDHLEE